VIPDQAESVVPSPRNSIWVNYWDLEADLWECVWEVGPRVESWQGTKADMVERGLALEADLKWIFDRSANEFVPLTEAHREQV